MVLTACVSHFDRIPITPPFGGHRPGLSLTSRGAVVP